MDIGTESLIVIILSIIILYLLYLVYYYSHLIKITSTVDNNDYYVQDKEDATEAANLIAKIREKLNILINHLKKSYPNDERTKLLIKNYKEDRLSEGVSDPRYTSYSVNKGEQIVLCLRNNDKLMDLNTMMFVVLHEMAHLSSVSIGHTDEFWTNFKWILLESINIGIYVKQDFNTKPVEYCGMSITSSPLDMNNTLFDLSDSNTNIIESFKLNNNYFN